MIDMPASKGSLKQWLDQPGVARRGDRTPPEETAPDDVFNPEEKVYRAHSRADQRMVPAISFILRDAAERFFQYGDLDTDYPGGCEFIPSAPGKGNVIKLQFAGSRAVVLVTIEGRNLRQLADDIRRQRIAWVHELPAGIDFTDKDGCVITAFHFERQEYR